MRTVLVLQSRTSADVIDHVITRYHERLRRDLPALIETARKVERVHAGNPDVPAGLADELADFWTDMQDHLDKEELVLFPMLRAGAHGAQVYMPLRVMEHEHHEHALRLKRIRELTGDLQLPSTACATWTALYKGLEVLEADLIEHMHVENNVLFPRAGGAV